MTNQRPGIPPTSSSIVPPGTCLIHGSFTGHACPTCSSVALIPGLNQPRPWKVQGV